MRSKKSLLVVLAVLLLIPAAAFANGGWGIDVRGGLGIPMGNFKDAYKSGLLVGLEASHMMSPKFALGVDGNYIKNNPNDAYKTALGTGTDAEAKFMHYGVHGKYMLSMKDSKMAPYFVGGAGLYNVKTEITPPSPNPATKFSDTKFGLRGGVGVNMMVGQNWGIAVQGDYNDIMTSGSSTQYVGLSAGLHFNLTPASHQ